MKINIKPLADRVLLEPVEAETKTASGIIIPDTPKKNLKKVKLLLLEMVLKNIQMNCKVGDTVLYGKYSGRIKVSGKDYLS